MRWVVIAKCHNSRADGLLLCALCCTENVIGSLRVALLMDGGAENVGIVNYRLCIRGIEMRRTKKSIPVIILVFNRSVE